MTKKNKKNPKQKYVDLRCPEDIFEDTKEKDRLKFVHIISRSVCAFYYYTTPLVLERNEQQQRCVR